MDGGSSHCTGDRDQDHPKKKKCKKAKWLSEEVLQIAVKRREEIGRASCRERGSQRCTGGRDQDHPQERGMQKGKMVV